MIESSLKKILAQETDWLPGPWKATEAHHVQRIHKTLEDPNLKIAGVISDTLRALLLVALRVFRHMLACALMAVLLHSRASWSESYTAQDAASHIGEMGTVCGLVVSSKFAVRGKGQLTFLNLDRPYPNHIFTVVIWGKDRVKFGKPDLTFAGKRICVWGLIADYDGRPEMMATDPAQITFP